MGEKRLQPSTSFDHFGLPHSDDRSRTRRGCAGAILRLGQMLQNAAGAQHLRRQIIQKLKFHANVRH